MRLVRLGQQPSKVADDIRAALAALGRGDGAMGGIALVGPRPPGLAQPVDAIVITPRGLLIVIGVELPDPAIQLHAPLTGPWRTDGWPLVRTDDAVNPAVDALTLSDTIADGLRDTLPSGTAVGTVVAVGPFVESIDQPPADLAGPIRVLYPTPTSMLAATVSLTSDTPTVSVPDVQELLALLTPDARQHSDVAVAAEGFAIEPAAPQPDHDPLSGAAPTTPVQHPPPALSTATAPAAPVPGAQQPAALLVPDAPQARVGPVRGPRRLDQSNGRIAQAPTTHTPNARRTGRWLPIASLLVLLALLVTAIVFAINGDDVSKPLADATPTPSPPAQPAGQLIGGVEFVRVAARGNADCAAHAFGDVQAILQRTGCASLRRGSFVATVEGRKAAVSVAVITLDDVRQAGELSASAETPGSGAITDLAADRGQWPTKPPSFAGAAYTTAAERTQVRTVRAAWLSGPSIPDDAGLVEVASASLGVPVPG